MLPAPGIVRLFLDIRELETFSGEQFHALTYPGPEYLAGKRVLVVGGGASAVQFFLGGGNLRIVPSCCGLLAVRPNGFPAVSMA